MASGDFSVRVLLADDHLLVRDALKRLIDDQPDMHVIAEAVDGQEALRLARERAPDVALVDVSMPGWDGVTVAQKISRECPSVKIIAVTRHDDGAFARRMLAAGACGYVLKQSAGSILVNAVRTCIAGAVYIDPGVRSAPSVAEKSAFAGPIVPPNGEPLTPLEDEVLRLFGTPLSTQSIAEHLRLDREHVEEITTTAMRKAGLRTRLQVIEYVRSRGNQ